jgi:phosphoribosylamine--glycine ligase
MNILIIGSGGREHALAWKISQSPNCSKLFVCPGNGGLDTIGIKVNLDPSQFDNLSVFVDREKIEMIVVGPEDYLVQGIVDFFEDRTDLMVIGPSREAAMLEGSKAFAKQFMEEFKIPTASYGSFELAQKREALNYARQHALPMVIKADGLAAGKGVVICQTYSEAESCIEKMFDGQFGEASARIVIESFLAGIEFSVFALTDGHDWKLLPIAKDYKKVGEGDTGLNTGGMGAVSPVPFVDNTLLDKVIKRIIEPTILGIQKRNFNYKGIVFFGLIEVNGEPFVIEYNCRFGDPETEVIIPRLKNDLLLLFKSLFNGTLGEQEIVEIPEHVCTVMYCSNGYPEAYQKGCSITLPQSLSDSIIFHAGTKLDDAGQLKSNGGRVLAVSSYGQDMEEALAKSYSTLKDIAFEEGFYRSDIGFDLRKYL